eukprot:TRINITY_DN2466_c0_g1_i2.p1 TRINITY_DN2466_c0_g1~~TRINITY_DN2466_c0_g1_i2.p1  ORF type:complete len:197 (-),score=56.78 TRINITY_DN2466_c0_g1_i2:81-671(-)
MLITPSIAVKSSDYIRVSETRKSGSYDGLLPLNEIRSRYEKFGPVHSSFGVILFHQNNEPVVLVLDNGNDLYNLPGGSLPQDSIDEMKDFQNLIFRQLAEEEDQIFSTKIISLLGKWYLPQFGSEILPYVPGNISEPKEIISIYLMDVPKNVISCSTFENQTVSLLSLSELMKTRSSTLRHVPVLLSRFKLIIEED